MTPSVPTAMKMPTPASQRNSWRGRITWCLGSGFLLHQAFPWLAVAEADRLEDVDGEVDPERLEGQERDATEDVEDARAQERPDEPEQARHLEADVAQEVVVEGTAQLDGLDDRREVVVGQDHHGGLLGDLRAGDAHRHPDVRHLERRRIVHAVAGHGHDVALAAEDLDEADLVLRGDPRDDTDIVDPAIGLVIGHGREFGAGDGFAHDAKLARDRLGRDGVVTRDHPDLDARRVRLLDGFTGFGTRRVDDPDERHEVEVRDKGQEVGVRIERARVEVTPCGGHDPQPLGSEPLVLGEIGLADLVDRVARRHPRPQPEQLARAAGPAPP